MCASKARHISSLAGYGGVVVFIWWRSGRVSSWYLFFFFQAEDGIRDYKVTGVQTCALPIYLRHPVFLPTSSPPALAHLRHRPPGAGEEAARHPQRCRGAPDSLAPQTAALQIGRASCRERV